MDKFTEVLQGFAKIREEQGEAAFEAAVREYAGKAIDEGSVDFLPGMAGAAFAEYRKAQEAYQEAQAKSRSERDAVAENLKQPGQEVDQAFLLAMQKSIPAMRSQAQFTAFMAAFDALRGAMNAIFGGQAGAEKEYLEGLAKAIDVARKVTDVTDRLRDVPEAAESKLADEFKQPPREFGEYDLQRALLTELAGIDHLEGLQRWWVGNRQRIDKVVSPSLRNPLIDAIRETKNNLTRGNA